MAISPTTYIGKREESSLGKRLRDCNTAFWLAAMVTLTTTAHVINP